MFFPRLIPPTLIPWWPWWTGPRQFTRRSMKSGGNWGNGFIKSAVKKKKVPTLFQNLGYTYFKTPWSPWGGHTAGLAGEWAGMKPISVSVESTWNSFTKPPQLHDVLAYSNVSEILKILDIFQGSLDRFVEASWKAIMASLDIQYGMAVSKPRSPWGVSLVRQDGEMPVWARGSGASWMCLFPSAVSINSSEAIFAKKETILGTLKISNAALRLSKVWDALLVGHVHNDYCHHHAELMWRLLTVLLPFVFFLQSCLCLEACWAF